MLIVRESERDADAVSSCMTDFDIKALYKWFHNKWNRSEYSNISKHISSMMYIQITVMLE